MAMILVRMIMILPYNIAPDKCIFPLFNRVFRIQLNKPTVKKGGIGGNGGNRGDLSCQLCTYEGTLYMLATARSALILPTF